MNEVELIRWCCLGDIILCQVSRTLYNESRVDDSDLPWPCARRNIITSHHITSSPVLGHSDVIPNNEEWVWKSLQS